MREEGSFSFRTMDWKREFGNVRKKKLNNSFSWPIEEFTLLFLFCIFHGWKLLASRVARIRTAISTVFRSECGVFNSLEPLIQFYFSFLFDNNCVSKILFSRRNEKFRLYRFPFYCVTILNMYKITSIIKVLITSRTRPPQSDDTLYI